MKNRRIIFILSLFWTASVGFSIAQNPALSFDGIKQLSTNSYTPATTNFSAIITIGCWGDLYIRNFNGSIDDVRFSSDAMYTSNFIPTCPDLMATTSTIGMWNFNESTGLIAVDSSTVKYQEHSE